jgi:hypothetical protein
MRPPRQADGPSHAVAHQGRLNDAQLVHTYRHQVSLKRGYQEALLKDESQWEQHIAEVEEKQEEIEKSEGRNAAC